MKSFRYFLLLLICSVGGGSCFQLYHFVDYYFEEKAQGHRLYEIPLFHQINNREWASSLLAAQIIWIEDEEDSWWNPETTWTLGQGDCEDIAILYLNILYFGTGRKGKLVLVGYGKDIVNGGFATKHCIVQFDGEYFDPITGTAYGKSEIMYEYSFDTVFSASF